MPTSIHPSLTKILSFLWHFNWTTGEKTTLLQLQSDNIVKLSRTINASKSVWDNFSSVSASEVDKYSPSTSSLSFILDKMKRMMRNFLNHKLRAQMKLQQLHCLLHACCKWCCDRHLQCYLCNFIMELIPWFSDFSDSGDEPTWSSFGPHQEIIYNGFFVLIVQATIIMHYLYLVLEWSAIPSSTLKSQWFFFPSYWLINNYVNTSCGHKSNDSSYNSDVTCSGSKSFLVVEESIAEYYWW